MAEDILNRIIAFADRAHGAQTRKYTPDRYIVHPVRVMEICRMYTQSLPVLAAALLHDVLEDTATTEEAIRTFLASLMPLAAVQKTMQLVVELTDIYTKSRYPQWNRYKRKKMEVARLRRVSAEAQTIKYADIMDNSGEIVQQDPDFAKRFLLECRDVLIVATRGNQELYKRTLEVVTTALATIR
ncbi:HD domain-containing protein [Niabella sp. CC-SYL272]|uniref:HD domain-containing protein n=1 Tax=Niabella agricola TaxID=2891571 RepID=UPI001F3E62D3|nr:HD domain-containing protein [Niabella agricola]MCF3108011.1 HD domain-containing protein [Niabella agricola]